MISYVRGVAADVDALGELARESFRLNSLPMDELVLLQNVSERKQKLANVLWSSSKAPHCVRLFPNHIQLKNLFWRWEIETKKVFLKTKQQQQQIMQFFSSVWAWSENGWNFVLPSAGGSDREWKSHHHNSKVVRKRFSIFLHSPGWRFSLFPLSLPFLNFFVLIFFAHDWRQRMEVWSFRLSAVFLLPSESQSRDDGENRKWKMEKSRFRPSLTVRFFCHFKAREWIMKKGIKSKSFRIKHHPFHSIPSSS